MLTISLHPAPFSLTLLYDGPELHSELSATCKHVIYRL